MDPIGGVPWFLWRVVRSCEECLQHWSKASPWVNSEWKKYHVLVVEFTDDVVAMHEWVCGCRGFVYLTEFSTFMMLKIIVCIGSYCVEDIISVRTSWGRWWAVILISAPIVV